MSFTRRLSYCLLLISSFAIALPVWAADKVYVANQDSDTVSVVDVETFSVIATIEVGDVPHNVNHTPDRSEVLVSNKNINVEEAPSLSIVDARTDTVSRTVRGIGSRIEHVVSVSSDTALVTEDLGENAVAVVDLGMERETEYIPVGVKPHGLWPSTDGQSVFVPNQLSGTLSKIDLAGQEVVAEAAVGRTPTMAAVSPDGNLVYVTLFGERGVAVVDARLVESGRMQVNDTIRVGERPAQVAVTPDGRYILVPCEGPGALYVIDSATHEVVAVIETGAGAHGVDVSEDSTLAFVTNRGPGTLTVVDLEQMMAIRQIEVGSNPAGVDFLSVAD